MKSNRWCSSQAGWENRLSLPSGSATGSLVPKDRRYDYGTVGCVVRDREGRLAAATSTGPSALGNT